MSKLGMKCKIQWITQENDWRPTPDDNEAVALVTADHTMGGAAMIPGGRIRVFPICAEHLKQMQPNWIEVHVEGLDTAFAKVRMEGYDQGKRDLADDLLPLVQDVTPPVGLERLLVSLEGVEAAIDKINGPDDTRDEIQRDAQTMAVWNYLRGDR